MTDAPGKKPIELWAVPLAVTACAFALFLWEREGALTAAVDDAYITFSFSKNLAQGHGPVYGHGLVVEGYSNFLWMVLLALGFATRPMSDPLEVARAMQLPFIVLLFCATFLLARGKGRGVWATLISTVAALLVAAQADVSSSWAMALETLPSAALLALGFLLYARSLDSPKLKPLVIPLFVAVALSRIDGFAPLFGIVGFEAARRWWRREGTWRDFARWAAPGMAVYAVWFVWRWHYYGLPLPSTYYAKTPLAALEPKAGLEYLKRELLESRLWLLFPLTLIPALRRSASGLVVACFVGAHLYYVRSVGGDWMPYGRFILPVIPLVAALAAWGSHEMFSALWPVSRGVAVGSALTSLALFGAVASETERHTTNPHQQWKIRAAVEQGTHVRNLIAAAHVLAPTLPSAARLVTDYGGVFAYFTDAAPIEMWGLCNATIATRGGHEGVRPIYGRTCPECYPELQPEYFHVVTPLLRDAQALKSHREVVNNVWQTGTIGRYLNFDRDFVSGRVLVPATKQALWFLQKRQSDVTYMPRPVGQQLVDYPFEPQGRAPGW